MDADIEVLAVLGIVLAFDLGHGLLISSTQDAPVSCFSAPVYVSPAMRIKSSAIHPQPRVSQAVPSTRASSGQGILPADWLFRLL